MKILGKRTFLATIISIYTLSAQAVVITAGEDDNFAGVTEATAPSAALISQIPGNTTDFDVSASNQNVAHTFSALPNNIASATLEFRVRGGSRGRVDNDGIFFALVSPDSTSLFDEIIWRRTFGEVNASGTVFDQFDTGIATPGSVWASGSEAFITLDLAALPQIDGSTVNVLPLINNAGFLDVIAGDETIVDFYRLDYEVVSVPEPNAAWLLMLAGLMFVSRKKYLSSEV